MSHLFPYPYLKFLILTMILSPFSSISLEARSLRLQTKRRSISLIQEQKIADPSSGMEKDISPTWKKFRREAKAKNLLERVVITRKYNHNFEYVSTIFRSMKGKAYVLNEIDENKYQRYILRKIDNNGNEIQKMSGIYAIVTLRESLREWMGHSTITLEYIRYGSLKTNILSFPLEVRNVADDRQIFIFLDSLLKNERNFIAWKVTLQDTDRNLSHSKASFTWNVFMGKR